MISSDNTMSLVSTPNNLSRRQATILSKRKAQEEAEALQQANAKEVEESKHLSQGRKSKKDAPPAWSEAEKDIFFQGVLAHGRDFDSLHKFCLARCKQGHNEAHSRNKDQIRHYYYRTVKNLQAKLISVSTLSSNKEANELFVIVNWAELRRRFGPKFSLRFLGKHKDRLCQMINEGEIRIKHNGAMRRIRTPACPPLKNLFDKLKSQGEVRDKPAKKEERRRPNQPAASDTLTLELQPRTNTAWQRVSDIQHNPHLRLKVKPEQNLSGIIATLEKKWIPTASRFRRELGLDADWNKRPHIKLYPERPAKFRSFHLSLFKPKESYHKLSLVEYLKLNGEKIQEVKEKKCDESGESADPARFLREKLEGITSQLLTNTNADSSTKATNTSEEQARSDSSLLSSELISQASQGWSTINSKALLVGYLHLMHGCPDKLILEYEFPDLEGNDHALHLFTGVINRLVTVADVEFFNLKTKKAKNSNTCSPPNTTSSPPHRGRKSACSPSTRRATSLSSPSAGQVKRASPSTRLVNIQAAPPSTEVSGSDFKRPSGLLCSSLADAIAAKKQQVKPLKRRPLSVHKTILPHPVPLRLTDPLKNLSILPKPSTTTTKPSTTTTRMNIRALGVICNRSLIACSEASVSTAQTSLNNNAKLTMQTEVNGVTLHLLETSNQSEDSTRDLLAQAMSALKTPVKLNETQPLLISPLTPATSAIARARKEFKRRRITPIRLSPNDSTNQNSTFAESTNVNVSNQNQICSLTTESEPSDSMAEHSTQSLGSLLSGLAQSSSHCDAANYKTGALSQTNQSFSFLPTSGGSLSVQPAIRHSDVKVNGKDTWLSPELAVNDLSLSSFLGCSTNIDIKSELGAAPEPTINEGMTEPGDDTRMSFLNKLDVAELGIESNLDMNAMIPDSMDYASKFKPNSSSLETPNKHF